MKSIIDGRLYSISNVFSAENRDGIWKISAAPAGRNYMSITGDELIWAGAAGEDNQKNGKPPPSVCAEYERLLGYSKVVVPAPTFNVVEALADDDDCAFDQPCAYGHRVESYAVYCHNESWLYAPRKCRRHSGNSGWGDEPWPHEECGGYLPNPRIMDAKP